MILLLALIPAVVFVLLVLAVIRGGRAPEASELDGFPK